MPGKLKHFTDEQRTFEEVSLLSEENDSVFR